jgi:hypothetical protein
MKHYIVTYRTILGFDEVEPLSEFRCMADDDLDAEMICADHIYPEECYIKDIEEVT